VSSAECVRLAAFNSACGHWQGGFLAGDVGVGLGFFTAHFGHATSGTDDGTSFSRGVAQQHGRGPHKTAVT
jgi:hypothetical protein